MTITQELIDAERVKFEAWLKATGRGWSEIAFSAWQAAISHNKALPEGWVAVPKEPTPEMLTAASQNQWHNYSPLGIYLAMLAAAPTVSDKALSVESEPELTHEQLNMIQDNAFRHGLTDTPADTVKQDALDELINAGKAVIERWDSPNLKDLPHTAKYIHRLRMATDALQAK
jgi:hypothetical protein